MELKQWLNRGYEISKRLAVKRAYLESLGNVISNYEARNIDRDNVENSAETLAIRWSETQKEVNELKRKLAKIDFEVDTELRKLKSSNEYSVMFLRYVRRLSWEDIADSLNYSKQSVFRFNKDGLENLERVNCYRIYED